MGNCVSFLRVDTNHTSDQILAITGKLSSEFEFALQNVLIELLDGLSFKRDTNVEHGVEEDSERPDVYPEPSVPFLKDDLRS